MLVAYEIGCSSDIDHGGKKLLTYLACNESLAVLAKRRHVPNGIIHS